MKYPFIAFAVASTLLLSACGDDSSSNANPEPASSSASELLSGNTDNSSDSNEDSSGTNANSSGSNASSSDSNAAQTINSSGSQNGAVQNSNSSTELPANKDKYTFTTTGQLYVNRTSQILQMTADEANENLCIVEGDNYSWKSLPLYERPDSAKFEYHGDTLLLFDISNGSVDRYADTYVGGTVGDVYGKWTATHCEYDKKTSKTDCNGDKPHYRTQIIEFSPGKIVSSLVVDVDKYIADHSDYMNSRLMLQIFGVLTGKRDNVYAEDIFDSDEEHKNTVSELQELIQSEQIHIINQSKTSESFELDGKTYTVDTDGTSLSLQGSGYYKGKFNQKVKLIVSDGTSSCKLDYVELYVDESLCDVRKAEFLEVHDKGGINENGIQFVDAFNYQKSNENEFTECLESITVVKKEI